MLNVSVKIDEEAIRRKILAAVESQVREKLESNGIHNVQVTAIQPEGDGVRLQFAGEEDDVKKATALFGK